MPEVSVEEKEVGYSKETVDEIIKRMKKLYAERGYTEEEAKAAVLKTVVTGSRAVEIETRVPAELALHKGILQRVTGNLFKTFSFLNTICDKLVNTGLGLSLLRDLDSANLSYSTKQYIAISMVASFLASIIISSLIFLIFVLSNLVSAFIFSFLAFVLLIPFSFFVAIKWPSSVALKRGRAIDKVLPFALRHFATEIKAGVGIHSAMESIANAGYGPLSEEFHRVLDEIDKGMTTEDALDALAMRSPSDSLSRTMMHTVRAIRTGGNLSDILSEIADEVSFDLRVRMRDFVERLTLLALFYMMAGIVLPVFISVLAAIFNAVPALGLVGILGPEVMMLVYIILIPLSLGLLLYIINVTQPM